MTGIAAMTSQLVIPRYIIDVERSRWFVPILANTVENIAAIAVVLVRRSGLMVLLTLC
ncbi:hypothetical protein [Chamaesiphon sp. OTE_75_metabat_556]|uniref:hypothetical protein n=1 Tax=Chamaesiphon sp. OTE_75_metabat_556 TaxID=2964692 RepID=UPI00286B9244|nr:hypothetical protein [Chamaesiphon sp. OTE_75_metabat_556]